MEWRDEAVVLGVRRHGETSVVAELMTRLRGRHLGLVRGGRSRKLQPVLQPGNLVEVTWRARLDEHMGTFLVEPLALRAARLIERPLALHAVQLLASHLRLLAEREPHPRLYEEASAVLADEREAGAYGALLLRFEVAILEELGFGLDLECCALTGESVNLAFVSPRTGRAVTGEAGSPWADKLLPLPSIMGGPPCGRIVEDLEQGFALTRHFLSRHFWEPRNTPEPGPRHAFVAELRRRLDAEETLEPDRATP